MKSHTKIVYEGEYLGPVDWNYDFASHGWTENRGGMNPALIPEYVERLRQLEHGEWEATTDGGSPKIGWRKVMQVGMYDGWPYWKPVPSVLLAGPLGAEWHSWCSITAIEGLPAAKEET